MMAWQGVTRVAARMRCDSTTGAAHAALFGGVKRINTGIEAMGNSVRWDTTPPERQVA